MLASRTDAGSFVGIFDRHFQSIYRYALRRAGEAVAEDIASETFLVAFDRRNSYRTDQLDARPWLFGIATNLMRRRRRAEESTLRAYARSGVEGVVDVYAAVDARLEAGRSQPVIARALLKLRRPERDALLLVAWADFTYEEVAAALKVPVGTIRSRLSRARKKLRKELRLQDQEDEPEFSWNLQGENS
jgi:RNA polymerase sigma-70 factor, ECF subfamily